MPVKSTRTSSRTPSRAVDAGSRAAASSPEGRSERASPWFVLREVVREAGVDGVGRLAAALSYFAVFSLPALLVLVIAAAGTVYGYETVETQFLAQVRGLVGEKGALALREMIRSAAMSPSASTTSQVLGIGGLLFGATGFFLQLQDALNLIWAAKRNARRHGFATFVVKRFLSFGMILGVALLLLVSLALSALTSIAGERMAAWLPLGASGGLVVAADFLLTGALTGVLLAAVYKLLPDLKIAWREVWLGAAAAAALFSAGKFAIGTYLGQSDLAAGYGAAGPLVVVLVWIYFSALVVLLGAEFTQVHARLRGPQRAARSRRMAAKASHDPDVHPEKGDPDEGPAGAGPRGDASST